MLKISLLGEWLIWIMVGYLSSPRRIISFIIDATLRKGSEKVSSASVSGYFWNGSPYWIFPGGTGGRIFYGERKMTSVSVLRHHRKKELLRKITGLPYI